MNLPEQVQQQAPLVKQVADSTLAVAAMSAPWWAEQVTTWGGVLAVIGGLVLLGVRIYVGVLEARLNKKKLEE